MPVNDESGAVSVKPGRSTPLAMLIDPPVMTTGSAVAALAYVRATRVRPTNREAPLFSISFAPLLITLVSFVRRVGLYGSGARAVEADQSLPPGVGRILYDERAN